MRILQLCKKYPYPPKDGESVAIANLAASLSEEGATLDLLAMNTVRHRVKVDPATFDLSFYQKVEIVPVDNRIKPVAAFLNFFSSESYHVQRFVSSAFAKKLIRLLQEEDYDIVQLETLYLAPYIPFIRKYSRAKICLRSHNVEHEIWERIVKNTSNSLKKWYLNYLTKKLKDFEISQFQEYDMIASISARDLRTFTDLGFAGTGIVIPVGFDPKAYQPKYNVGGQALSIGFIGSLDWMPNVEGLQWFLENAWPGVHTAFPDLELHIAGRNTPEWLLRLRTPKVVVHGEVESARDFICSHPISLVPLLSGSGIRVKILEAMALGKVVLTTTLGLEGVKARTNYEVLIANEPADFLEQLRYCQIAPDRVAQIGQHARELVINHYDRRNIARQLLSFYESNADNS
jgi:glycosyltransferase involved in cell wall biosynthesis